MYRSAGVKNAFLIGRTMEVKKTTVCRIIKDRLNNSVFLDGDGRWDMYPFQVTEETKANGAGEYLFPPE